MVVTPNDLERLTEAEAPFVFYLHHETGDRLSVPCWPEEEVAPDVYLVTATFRPHSGLWVASCVHTANDVHINGVRKRMHLSGSENVTITAHVPW